jgi:uncharacterized membrane protein
MDTFWILGLVALAGFLLVGVPIIALSSRNQALQTRALIEPLTGQIARLQQQIDALKALLVASEKPSPEADSAVTATPRSRAAARQKSSGAKISENLPTATASTALPPPIPAAMMPTGALPPPLPPGLATASFPSPKGKDYEELIGTRWAIWVGGLALALGSLFLVRYTIEAGYFGPSARLLMAAAFSTFLLAAGEMLRRGALLPRRLAELPVEHAPLALTAAGIVGLFGTVYAAYAVYDFIPQSVTFILLGLIGLAAMAAALLHGQALAGIGLVASFATPVLIGGESSSRWPLVIFLLAVTAAAMAVQSRLRTFWLGWAVIIGVALWTGLLILGQGSMPVAELAFMLAALAVFALGFCWYRLDQTPMEEPRAVIALSGLAAAMGLSFVFQAGEPGLFAVFAILAVLIIAATAVFSGRAALAMVAAGLLPLGMILTWPSPDGVNLPVSRVVNGALLIVTTPPSAPGFLGIFSAAAAILLGGLPLALFLRRVAARLPHLPHGLMAVAITAGLSAPLLVLAWALRDKGLVQNWPAAGILALLCGLLAATTMQLLKRGDDELAQTGAGGYGAGTALALGLAIALALPGLWMAVGFAAAALFTAMLSDRHPLPMLRRTTAAFATTALLRAITAPVYQPEAAWPVLNSYLVAYGLPAVLLAGAAYVLSRRMNERNVTVTGAMAALMAALFTAYEIRHAFHGAELFDRLRFGLGESGLYVLACLLPCLVLFGLRGRFSALSDATFKRLVGGISTVGLVLAVILILGLANPWLGVLMSGPPVVDSAFVGMLLPAMAMGVLAYLGRTRPHLLATVIADANRILAIALGYLYILAQTRRFFTGTARFATTAVGDVEQYAYSAVTLAFGVALLAIGFRLGSRPTRLASAVFVTLAVLKVFLLDMAELTGLLRALSFIGLGGVLIGIGLAYQRLLFDHKARPEASTDGSLAPDKPPG